MDPLKLYNTINTGRNVGVFIIDFIPIDFSPITKKELLWPYNAICNAKFCLDFIKFNVKI